MKVPSRPIESAPIDTPDSSQPGLQNEVSSGEAMTGQGEPGPTTVSSPAGDAADKTKLQKTAFFDIFDWFLAGGIVVLGFVIASFSVRNSDYYQHLAVGRLMTQGKYEFGKDPLSFVGADRLWVNHAWLFDRLLFHTHSIADGKIVVFVKAAWIALFALLLLAVRRRGTSIFPSIVAVGLTLLASSPRMLLQPVLGSYVFLTLTLLLILRYSQAKWFPIAIALLFALWANLDNWFFLGVTTLGLYTAGLYAQRLLKLPGSEEESLSLRPLLIALVVGILACNVGPHHIHVWSLPPELVDGNLAETFSKDGELNSIFRGIFDKGSLDYTGDRGGNPLNVFALIMLVLFSLGGAIINFRRTSLGLAFLWLFGLILILGLTRAVPFFAIYAAVLGAWNWGVFREHLAQQTLPAARLKSLNFGRFLGRGLAAIVGVLLLAIAWPGWLHPLNQNRRISWDLEPDVTLQKAAERLQQWREKGLISEEAHGLILQTDLAHYCAWFAPAEKTFFDFRFAFHAPEADEFVRLKQSLQPRDPSEPVEKGQKPYDLNAFVRNNKIGYIVTAHPVRTTNLTILGNLLREAPGKLTPPWVLWSIDGRVAILGYDGSPLIKPETMKQLAFDPIRELFDKPLELLASPPKDRLPNPDRDLAVKFLEKIPVVAPQADEAALLMQYQKALNRKELRETIFSTGLLGGGFCTLIVPSPTSAMTANALLTLRTARQAIVQSPDHPDGYYFLAQALQRNNEEYPFNILPMPEDMRGVTELSALARCQARMPNDPSDRRSSLPAYSLHLQLAERHGQANRFDLSIEAQQKAIQQLEAQFQEAEANKVPNLEGFTKEIKGMKDQVVAATEALRKRENSFENAAKSYKDRYERAVLARAFNLYGEALRSLREADLNPDPQKPEKTGRIMAIGVELVELLIIHGSLEEASALLDSAESSEAMAAMNNPEVVQAYLQERGRAAQVVMEARRPNVQISARPFNPSNEDPRRKYRGLRTIVAYAMGDFARVIELRAADGEEHRESFQRFIKTRFPVAPKQLSQVPNQDLTELIMLSPNMVGNFLAGIARNELLGALYQYQGGLLNESTEHTILGLTLLEQGNVAAAREQFRLGLDSRGYNIQYPTRIIAETYIKMIPKK